MSIISQLNWEKIVFEHFSKCRSKSNSTKEDKKYPMDFAYNNIK